MVAQRCVVVDYADRCANPRATMNQIGEFLESGGVSLSDHADVPDRFREPSKHVTNSGGDAEIREALIQVESGIR